MGTSLGVDIFIVLNLRILKIFLFLPTRFCLKTIVPGSVTKIAIVKIIHTGIRTIIATNEIKKSKSLFKKCLYIRKNPQIY